MLGRSAGGTPAALGVPRVGVDGPPMNHFTLPDMLGRSAPDLDIVDVGAMWLGADDCPYLSMLKSGKARLVGFEPVQSECDKLNRLALKGARFLPYFIGDGTERTFHLCSSSMTSSLFEPNTALLKRFNGLEYLHQVVKTERVQTKRLDDISEITSCHFLKLDVQGAELDVFRGAEKLLAGTLVIQAEVNFVSMYKGQPLFGEVDCYLRSKGFVPHALLGPQGRTFFPLVVNNDTGAKIHQAMWADMIYVRDFMRFDELSADDLLRLAIIVHEVCHSYDLAAHAIQHAHYKGKTGLWQAYMTRLLGKVTGEVPPLP